MTPTDAFSKLIALNKLHYMSWMCVLERLSRDTDKLTVFSQSNSVWLINNFWVWLNTFHSRVILEYFIFLWRERWFFVSPQTQIKKHWSGNWMTTIYCKCAPITFWHRCVFFYEMRSCPSQSIDFSISCIFPAWKIPILAFIFLWSKNES